jgi:hypothetical protein
VKPHPLTATERAVKIELESLGKKVIVNTKVGNGVPDLTADGTGVEVKGLGFTSAQLKSFIEQRCLIALVPNYEGKICGKIIYLDSSKLQLRVQEKTKVRRRLKCQRRKQIS